VQNGSFTRVDGQGNTSTGQAGSFILAQNNFVQSFTPITVSDAARALPNIAGTGWVRDLQEAATQSPELIAIITQAKEASTRAGYDEAVATLMRAWGNDSAYSSASKQALTDGYGLILSDPADAQEAGWMDPAIKASAADRDAFRGTLSNADRTKFDAMRERMVGGLEKVYAYEAFTGYTFLNWAQVQGDAIDYTLRSAVSSSGRPVEVWVPLSQIIQENRNAALSSQSGHSDYAICFIATHARQSGATSRFYCGKKRIETKNQRSRFRINRSNTKIAHASCVRLAGHRWLRMRVDSAWTVEDGTPTVGQAVTQFGVDMCFKCDVCFRDENT